MPAYTWLTFAQAKNALRGRLANNQFWIDVELGLYLIEGLRVWNALTESWPVKFSFTPAIQNSGNPWVSGWNNMGTLAGSPRLRTVTDADLYTEMQYHLLEPPTGAGTWTGTSQFSLAEMQFALQKRRDEAIQSFGCNLAQISLASTPNVSMATYPDTTLEPKRNRFVPAAGFGNPVTLTREDDQSFDYFDPGYAQQPGLPASWGVIAQAPLTMGVDHAPNVAGRYDSIVLQSGPSFAPPAASLLGMPDDHSYLAKYGAMADLLGRESEATDRARAAYCLQRFIDGMKIAKASNFMMDATVGNASASTTSLYEKDWVQPEWEQSVEQGWPEMVIAGVDFLAVYPIGSPSAGLTLISNAPIPSADGDFIQASRDVFDVILSYAQHIAAFKDGGEEFAATKVLLDDFYKAAQATNNRVAKLGLFTDVMRSEGRAEDIQVKRE